MRRGIKARINNKITNESSKVNKRMNNRDNKDLQLLWQFISEDLSTAEFESWLYDNDNLENILGKDLYLEAIATDFRCSKYQIPSLKEKLKEFLLQKFPLDCECITRRDLDIADLGSAKADWLHTLEELKRYGESRWWLSLEFCKKCSQHWLVAQEERQNDIYCYKRLTKPEAENIIQQNEWPSYFESLEELILMGNINGSFVIHTDPLNSSLSYTIKELKEARPSITIKEIASLLNINKKLVIKLLD
jgi:hypothetical protein